MIRTKAYLLREIAQFKKRKKKLLKEREFAKSAKEYFKKTVPLLNKEIDNLTVKIQTLDWCANTNEKHLPKIKSKKKKKEDKKEKEKEKKE